MEVPSKNNEWELNKANIRRELLSLKVPTITWDKSSQIQWATFFLIENPRVKVLINQNPELKRLTEDLKWPQFAKNYNKFIGILSHTMVEQYKIFVNTEMDKSETLFIEAEAFEDPNWKSVYNKIRRPWEPTLVNGITFYRRTVSSGWANRWMTRWKDILLDIGAIDKESKELDRLPWKNTTGFFWPNNFKNAIVANELASVAFDAMMPETLTFRWDNGEIYTHSHLSEFYSDVISSRVDIRDMRRIILQSVTGKSYDNYALTNAIVRKYLKDKEIYELKGRENDIQFLTEVRNYMEAVWEFLYKNMQKFKNSKK